MDVGARLACGGALALAACAGGTSIVTETAAGSSGAASSTSTTSSSSGGTTAEPTTTSTTSSTGAALDLGGREPDMGPPPRICAAQADLTLVGPCAPPRPAGGFTPAVEWTFGEGRASWVTPLVGNFTDDNADGAIDLCDVPDVVLVSGTTVSYGLVCELHNLDGTTGFYHYIIPATEMLSCTATPAFADIDADGKPEIVAVYNHAGVYRLKAFEHNGTLKWANVTDGNVALQGYRESGAVAIHDLDADGDAEILFNHEVYDHQGVLLWAAPNPLEGELEASVAADLDGDGKMEVITGHAAYHHDGTPYWDNYPKITSQAIPQVGDLDGEPNPEVLLTSGQGLWLVEHDGVVKWGPALPTGVQPAGYLTWQRPATIADFDGDGLAEYASSSRDFFAVYQGPNPADVLWKTMVLDASGGAGGAAFDFLGDGLPEAMYADEQHLQVFDGQSGDLLLSQKRFSPTISEYPVVADVDNDGSAEILVVSYSGQPALQVLGDAEGRWAPARRIWNQHTYHITNVREDGTLPVTPVPSWKTFNTFRAQAQITPAGDLCVPR